MAENEKLALLARAAEIVSEPETKYGYGDVGDTLVAYLRGRKTYAEAMWLLECFATDYERARARGR